MILNKQELDSYLNKSQGKKVAFLGGSFNPVHHGHLSVTIDSIKKYQFDYVVWLVAHQNPFKPKYKDDIFTRAKWANDFINKTKEDCSVLESSKELMSKIIISTLEYDLNYYETFDTITYLTNQFSRHNLTWLMGLDNIEHFHKWKNAQDILSMINMIIFNRDYGNKTKIFSEFSKLKRGSDKTSLLLCDNKLYNISSTSIRENKNRKNKISENK